RLPILRRSLFPVKRIVSADRERKRGGGESGLPSSVPGAHHDRDREHHQPALRDIREEQGWDQRQHRTQESNSITQQGIARRRYGQAADDGEFHSHEFMLCANRAPSELRQSTAVSWRHSGQRYSDQAQLKQHNLGATSSGERPVFPIG